MSSEKFNYEYIDSLLSFRNFQEAENLILERLYDQPDDLFGITYAGIIYTETKRYDQAERALDYVLSCTVSIPDAWEARGVVYFRRGRFDQARDHFIRALQCAPTMSSAFRNLGVLYRHTGDKKKSLTCLQLARQYNPSDYLTLYALSFGLIEARDYAQAQDVLTLMLDQVLPPDIMEYAQDQLNKIQARLGSGS
jgi:tetratricopeptide (TPR) repeat protein